MALYVTLKDGKNIFINVDELITPGLKDIRRVVYQESRLIKNPYSDTLYVYFRGDKYSIIIYVDPNFN